MIRPFLALAAVAVLTLASRAHASDDVRFETWNGSLVQQVEVLSPQQAGDLKHRIADLERRTGRRLAVVVLGHPGRFSIEDHADFLEQGWAISPADKAKGVILVIGAHNGGEAIVVGHDLASVFGEGVGAELLDAVHRKRVGDGLVSQADATGAVLVGADAALRQLSLPDEEARRLSQAADERLQARVNEDEAASGVGAGVIAVCLLLLIGGGIWLNRIEARLPPHLRRKQKVGIQWGRYSG